MNDIDRAVERATYLAFVDYTENRDFSDPEPDPVYCAVCGDVEVEEDGNACDRCVDSDDDEMREMARVIRERDAVLAASPLTGGCREPLQK